MKTKNNSLTSRTYLAKVALRAALMASALIFSVGCSVQGEIKDMTERTLVPRLGQQMAFVSGANQNETVSGYKVSSSVGHWSTGMVEEVNGYKVYSTVQGNLTAETVMEVLSQ